MADRAVKVGTVCGGLLLAGALALPWAGWEELQTVGPGIGWLGVAGLAVTLAGIWQHGAKIAVVAGVAAILLIASRLASPPVSQAQSVSALALGLAGSVVVTLAGLLAVVRARSGARRSRIVGLSPDQRAALAVVWRALWSSRLLVWTAGVLGVLELGLAPMIHPPGRLRPFGSLGNLLAAPASAWDAGNYVLIAHSGYAAGSNLRAYFPAYPIIIRAGAWSPQALLITGIIVSLAAFVLALYLLHRLVTLERGRQLADLSVLVVAFSPMALFFSAVYTESVFLAASVGAFYAARRGWWGRAGVVGALAAATRSTGVTLLLPLLVLYLYGPRGEDATESETSRLARLGSLAPRYSLGRDAAFLLLIPAGALACFAYSGAHGDVLGPLHAQQTYWYRRFVPGLGAVHGLLDAIRSLHQIAVGSAHHVLSTWKFGELADPLKLAAVDLTDFGFLIFACVAGVGALRRLPAAYGIYAIATIMLTISTFPPHEPLESFPRFLVVIFPCQIWLAQWATTPARRQATLLISAGLLAFFATQFASWRWVA